MVNLCGNVFGAVFVFTSSNTIDSIIMNETLLHESLHGFSVTLPKTATRILLTLSFSIFYFLPSHAAIIRCEIFETMC